MTDAPRPAPHATARLLSRLATGASTLSQRLSPETRGALGMVVATFFFISMDSFAKALSDDLPPMMVVWARYVSQTVVFALIFAVSLPRLIRTENLGQQLLRGGLLFTVTALFFTALQSLELAEAIALVQLAPLMIVALAALLLREHVGPRRWIAVGIGLLGALLIIRPGLGVFQPAALYAVAAAFCFASFQVLTRVMSGTGSIWTTMLYTSLVGAALASATLPWTWVTPPATALPAMLAVGVMGLIGHVIFVWAAAQVPASVLAPFNYTSLVWATLMGLVFFGELPATLTVVGACVIVGAGLYVWHRERRPAVPPPNA
ncbi:MAG: DMT family transporter [Pseudomonadota bacterium]